MDLLQKDQEPMCSSKKMENYLLLLRKYFAGNNKSNRFGNLQRTWNTMLKKNYSQLMN